MAGYCALVVEHTASQAIQYFVSTYISAEANLYALLVITILAVPLFTVADIHYGSGTSRNICGRKRLERQERDLVDNGCTQSELTAVSSNKEKGMCGSIGYYFHQACHQCLATWQDKAHVTTMFTTVMHLVCPPIYDVQYMCAVGHAHHMYIDGAHTHSAPPNDKQ